MESYVPSGEPLNEFLRSFWQHQREMAEGAHRQSSLPLARLKKVMKSDPEVKMISADAPLLFCKACEIFISEITARAYIVADSNKRRTLSRSDITEALSKSDQFDFLLDIVPRESLGFSLSRLSHNPYSGAHSEKRAELTKGISRTIDLWESDNHKGIIGDAVAVQSQLNTGEALINLARQQ